MVTKSKKASAGKKRKTKVLNLNKETVRDLTADKARRVKGGSGPVIRTLGGSFVDESHFSTATINKTVGCGWPPPTGLAC
jgi:hypothetical protein